MNANHIIFLGAFWCPDHHSYTQSMTQCVGRARRYGQKKTVFIYRIIGLNTIDVDVLEWREGKQVARRNDGSDIVELVEQLGPQHEQTSFATGFLESNDYLDRDE